jgi:twitching motility protein PilT
MPLVESLLNAIIRADGDALVMHVGEKPYVVASAGPIELSTQGLNLQAMTGMVAKLLPFEAQHTLSEVGAVEHHLDAMPVMRGDRFTVVVARGGDDIWIEMRRHRQARTAASVAEPAAAAPPAAADTPAASEPVCEPVHGEEPHEPAPTPESASTAEPDAPAAEPAAMQADPRAEDEDASGTIGSVAASVVTDSEHVVAEAPSASFAEAAVIESISERAEPASIEPEAVSEPAVAELAASPEPSVVTIGEAPASCTVEEVPSETATGVTPASQDDAAPAQIEASVAAQAIEAMPQAEVGVAVAVAEPVAAHEPELVAVGTASPGLSTAAETPAAAPADSRSLAASPSRALPMTRTLRIEVPPSNRPPSSASEIERLLGMTVACGATALFLTAKAPPHVRVEHGVRALDGEPPLTSTAIESAVLELMPETCGDAFGRGEPTDWFAEVAGVGRVRCSTFRDYRGTGAIFQLVSVRPPGAEQLGLTGEMQALATESEGLIVVASPPAQGKSSVVGAVIDLINRQRGNYVITLERQVRFVHEHRHALISQREVSGSADQLLLAARAALGENPDVLVIEDLATADLFQLALDAAGSGSLVIVTVTATSTTAALSRLVDLCPVDTRTCVQSLLAERLRGAIAQVLLHQTGGGRVAARELLLMTAAVASVLLEGQLQDLPRALENGRRHGLRSLTDALVELVRTRTIDVREAYRKTDDREGLLAALRRENIDVSLVERLA